MAYQSEIEKLQKQWEANPGQHFAPYAEALRKGGDTDLAIDVVRAGLEKRPNYLSAHIVLGRCLVDQKNDAEATKVFEHVLGIDAENIIALRFLSEITERAGDVTGAQRWVKRLLDVDPMNDDAIDALKRLEAATPPAAPMEAAAPEEEPADVVSAVSGFEATAMEASPPSAVSGSDDMVLEKSSSTYESEADAPGARLSLESSDVSLEEGATRGAKLDLEPAESGMVNLDAPGTPDSSLPSSPPTSYEPPMLAFEEPPAVAEAAPEQPATPEPELAPAPRTSGRRSSPRLTPAPDLPLFMPDEEPAAAPPPPPSVEAREPEPVITETMAEVYLKQGLVVEARDVYRKLVERRPDDAALRERLASLERQGTAPSRGVPAAPAAAPQPAPSPGARPRFAAAETGGSSARSLFGQVLSSRPGSKAPPSSPPSSRSAMDAAFADEPVQATGAPTRPTSDELSLASVFGEEPAPPPPAGNSAEPQPPAQAGAGTGGFSFDEFFGGKPPAEASPPAKGETPPADSDGQSPDDFVSWLKGLKS